jgi:hypothetical protein
MGWSNGGKTSILLAFTINGAEYVGDEWIILTSDGKKMFGYPISLSLSKWQLDQMADSKKIVTLNERITFAFLGFLSSLFEFALKAGLSNLHSFQFLSKFLKHTKNLMKKKILPHNLFGDKIRDEATPVDLIMLSKRHDNSEIIVKQCDANEVIDRMINSNDYEQLPFFEYYKAFKYAFPERNNEFLDNIKKTHSDLLRKALQGKKSIKVFSPNPVSLENLFSNLAPALLD